MNKVNICLCCQQKKPLNIHIRIGMDDLPSVFPALPDPPDNGFWSGNILRAYSILHDSYAHGTRALNSSDNDSHRLRLHADRILNSKLAILEALEPEVVNPLWVRTAAHALAGLVVELERASVLIDDV
jgi:hypothetical protein